MQCAEGWISKAWGEFAGPEDNSAADRVNAAADSLISVAISSVPEVMGLAMTSIQLTDSGLSQSGADVVVECQAAAGIVRAADKQIAARQLALDPGWQSGCAKLEITALIC